MIKNIIKKYLLSILEDFLNDEGKKYVEGTKNEWDNAALEFILKLLKQLRK